MLVSQIPSLRGIPTISKPLLMLLESRIDTPILVGVQRYAQPGLERIHCHHSTEVCQHVRNDSLHLQVINRKLEFPPVTCLFMPCDRPYTVACWWCRAVR